MVGSCLCWLEAVSRGAFEMVNVRKIEELE